jgi:hypothetical protein
MHVSSLHIYPVKALRGLSAEAVDVEPRGIAGDRRRMIVDDEGIFITQREVPALATLTVEEDGHGPLLRGPTGMLRLHPPRGRHRRRVRVWNDVVEAMSGDPETDARLSDWVGQPVALVHMDEKAHRPVDPAWHAGAETSFADGFPLLVVGTASLQALNTRMSERGAVAVPMARFRPNLVVETDEPFVEDRWARIAVGDVELDFVKPCARCVVTTTDQVTGRVAEDKEPLATLATFRRSRDRRVPGVLFGWNAVPRGGGGMRVGQPVEVVESREPWPVG